jgi:hypothetical protein
MEVRCRSRGLAYVVAAIAAATYVQAGDERRAYAQTGADSERAEKLFVEATVLASKGDFAAACPKFEESQHLDPAIGTQFNLALCFEKIGRIATAWRHFRDAERVARSAGKTGREQAAHQKVVELQPKVSALVLTPHEPDVTVKVDAQRVDPAEMRFYAVEPGEHVVEATAPAKHPWSNRIKVGPRADGTGELVSVDIPALAAVAGETRVVTVHSETTNKRRTIGFVSLGIGAVGAAGAAVTGIMLLNDKAVADDRCARGCDQEGNDAASRGKGLLPVNAVAWGVAIVGVGVGTFLVLTSNRKPSPSVQAATRRAILSGEF